MIIKNSQILSHNWSVVTGTMEFYDFPYLGNVIIPTDELIFFRGVGQPPTSLYLNHKLGILFLSSHNCGGHFSCPSLFHCRIVRSPGGRRRGKEGGISWTFSLQTMKSHGDLTNKNGDSMGLMWLIIIVFIGANH